MAFPTHRPQRLRRTPGIRRLAREGHTLADGLVAPLFIREGKGVRAEISSMPGVYRLSVDAAVEEARRLRDAGVPALLLFGVVPREKKDACGAEAWNDNGLVQKTLREIRTAVPELVLVADTCFCEYTDHGHCGKLDDAGRLDDAWTLEALGRTAVSQARAGADFIAPSGMLDGMVRVIRAALDTAGLTDTAILSYAVKYASAFYGPFRDAADSAPAFGDRRAHQMDPANVREAVREAKLDLEEGADAVMVKPALPCLDVIRAVREVAEVPLAAYSVSGEYAAVKAAALRGWLDEKRTVLETAGAVRRAGADILITYWAAQLAAWTSEPDF